MKKFFLFILIAFLFYIFISLFFLDKAYFFCPIEYKDDIYVRSDARGDGFFGSSRSRGRRTHQGIDLFAKVGTPVLAARSGRVIAAEKNRGMGNYVIIRHFGGVVTVYGHLSKFYTRKGEFVRQGEVIGRVGKTGNANYRDIQPHLHLEVRQNGVPQDPLQYLE